MKALAFLASWHGHIGVLAVALLVHPAILLRRGTPLSRGARWAIGLAAALTTITFSLGIWLYEPYRDTVRRPLFAAARHAGWLFETKEHLAYVVICLTLGATACAFLAPREDAQLRRLASIGFAAAATLAFTTAAIGTYVASIRAFER